jgi:hypothetical protein
MAQSLVKLTLESNQYERGLKQAQQSLKSFTSAIGVNMKSLSGMALAAGAVTTAMKVAKDAFFKNEQQLDEWGRTVEASKSLYSGFLNAINNGDISGFLSNINNITEAARAAYDALDELSTFNAFNQIQTQKTRTGFTEAMAGYRMGEGSKEDVQKAAKAYQDELRLRQEKEQKAYSQAVRKIAAERGVPWGNLEQALTGKYGDYEKLKNTMPTGKRIVNYGGGMFGGGGSYEVPMAVTAQEKMGEALRQLNDTELKELQALGAQAQRTGEEIAQIDKQMARVLNGRKSGSSGSGGSGSGGGGRSRGGGGSKTELTEMQQNQQTINTLTQEYVRISDNANEGTRQRQEEIRKEIQLLEQRNNLLKLRQEQAQGKLLGSPNGGDINTVAGSASFAGLPEIGKGLSDETMEKVREGMAKMNQTAKESKQSFGLAANAAGALGSALAGIDDPGARAAGIVLQSIASIAMGFAAASASPAVTGTGWGWLAFLGAGIAALATTISTIHQLTNLAEGGIVGGNSYSGDNIYGGGAMVNSGELVLNKAQQGNLASQLQGNGINGMNIRGRIKGTDIILSVDRTLQLQGKELLTWG